MAAVDWAYRGGNADEACALAAEALERGRLAETETGLFAISAILTLALADVAALDAAVAAAHRDGSLFGIASIHLFYGIVLLWRGDLAGAHEMLTTGKGEFDDWGFAQAGQAYLDAHLARVATERGELAAARRALEASEVAVGASDAHRYQLNAAIELEVEEGRWEAAVATGERLQAAFGFYTSPAAGRWRSALAIALDRLGRRDEALARARAELDAARAWGAPGVVGHALRVLGTLEGDLGRLEEAVDVLDGSPARLDLAKALAALGAALRRERRPTEAREPLRRALELAAACDAPGLAEQVRTELYATGARPRSDAVAGAAALTASERRVAALAADGATNRDIAQTLFVTPKTVEVHLSNAYRKLGIRSRRELAGALTP
jgi:DNA-binding CsgD family transcriptional regulator/Flp pilus assembly protein TadD